MADVFDKATRSRIMRAIRSRDTKPELALASALRRAGVRYRRDARHLPGSPDFIVVTQSFKLAVFAHGCFWHLCQRHYRGAPASEGWLAKMDRNRRRDIRVRRRLRALGWHTMIVWEHEQADSGAARVRRRCLRLSGAS